MAAAAVPAVPLNNYELPAGVLDELLTRYKFTAPRLAHEPESFVWQEKDPQFRYLPVLCSGFAPDNDGAVYVNGEILSMLSDSEDLVIEFDCSKETFDTVMTFAHSMQRSNRTVPQLLELLPLVRECKLPLLFDALALCIVLDDGVPLREAFSVGMATESLLLVEYCFKHMPNAVQLGHLVAGSSSIFRRRPQSAFVIEVSLRMAELNTIIPPAPSIQPNEAEQKARREFHEYYDCIQSSIVDRLRAKHTDVKTASPLWDLHLSFDDDKDVFASREIVAHASRFFHHSFYSGFAWQEDCAVPVDGVYSGDYVRLLMFLLPTIAGLFWRITAAAPASEPEQEYRTAKCQFIYDLMFDPDRNSDPDRDPDPDSDPDHEPVRDQDVLLRLFQLAVHYQMCGLANYLTDVAVHCLPWRERLRFADSTKSREVMASLLNAETVDEIRGSEDTLEEIGGAKELMIEYLKHLFVF